MHVRELSQRLNVDEGKLSTGHLLSLLPFVSNYKFDPEGHMLRLLATHLITREVRPNVFANNRISAIIDSGRQAEDLQRS